MMTVELKPPLRMGVKDDAELLAELVNYAGEGLPFYLWSKLAAPEVSAWDVGRQRAEREEGAFSYRNAILIEEEGEAAGCVICYAIADRAGPVPDDMPAMFRPLQELENLAPGSWYVNVLGVVPLHRGKGLGRRLLAVAEEFARDAGKAFMSVIVSDANPGARRLYERCGYTQKATREMVKEDWENDGQNWVLLTKPL